MVMSAQFKLFFRLLKRHLTRLLTIIAIVVVSVGFMAGIGEVENKIKISVDDYYISQNVSDIYLKSKNQLGFSQQEINYIENQFSHHNIMKTFCYETYINDELVRVYSYDIENANINKLQIVEGNFPKAGNEIVVERKTSKINGYELGQEITLNNNKFTVCGIVLNPLILNQVEEPSFQYENKHIENVIYINTNNNFITNDIYIALENRLLFDSFSKNYKQTINNTKTQIINELGEENVSVLGLSENFGIYSLVSYAEKVGLIGIIFVVFFLLVTLLVVYSTMSRLIEEERSHIACQKTLGCSDTKIIVKYILFVLFATLVGGLLAFGVGLALTKIIYSAFNLQYAMPPFPTSANFVYYLLTFVIILLATTILTTLTAVKIIRHKPVVLLTPKAPKKGKKVFMEKIPFVWNRLSFKYKSTFRNVLLFKSRFLMTVVSVIGATVLVFAGLGLMDCATKIDGGSSLITISAALIVFSAILCALVIYNLTNINVSERSREISTLMVLGYNNKEITGYIFREVYIMSAIGAVLGIPLGYGFIGFVFSLIDFGAVTDINWWTYLITPIVTMIFSFLSTRLLYKKITKTDMNASLKSIE